MQVQGALLDLTSAYVQSEGLPSAQAPLRAFSATALASVFSRRGLLDIASPLFDEALAAYKGEGFTFDVLTTYIRQSLAKSADGQAAGAIRDFRSLLSSPRIDLISEDILAVVQANLCQA